MSDLRPIGELVVLEGEERHLLFTLNAIDEIQDRFDKPLEEVIDLLGDKKQSYKAMKGILAVLLKDEADRLDHDGTRHKLKNYTEKEIGWLISPDNLMDVMVAILKAYGLSLPEPDEFESPNAKSGQTK